MGLQTINNYDKTSLTLSVAYEKLSNIKPKLIIQKIIPVSPDCLPTKYIIEDETGSPSTRFSVDLTTDQVLITCSDPSCILNTNTYNFKVKACFD